MLDKKTHPIIDFHVHCYPDDLANRVVGELTQACGFQACFDGTVKGLQTVMKKSGVDVSIVQPIATKVSQVRVINTWCAEINQYEGIQAFGTLHPDLSQSEIENEVAFIVSHHLPGVKMHPEYQNFYPDEDRLEMIYQSLEKNHLMLLLHAGKDLGFAPPVKATPPRLLQVLKGFPELTLIAAHLGGYGIWDQVANDLAGTAIWLDTAYCLGQPPGEEVIELMQAHGAHKILFGSDAPWGDQAAHVSTMQLLPFSDEDKLKIVGGNAAALLGKSK